MYITTSLSTSVELLREFLRTKKELLSFSFFLLNVWKFCSENSLLLEAVGTSDDRLLPLDVTFASLATEFPQIGQNKYPNSRGESHDTHFFFLKAAMLSLETKHPENRGKTYAISYMTYLAYKYFCVLRKYFQHVLQIFLHQTKIFLLHIKTFFRHTKKNFTS